MKKTIEIITCDRCGTEVKTFEISYLTLLFNVSFVESFYFWGHKIEQRKNKINEEREDLCQECYKSFQKWRNMENGK